MGDVKGSLETTSATTVAEGKVRLASCAFTEMKADGFSFRVYASIHAGRNRARNASVSFYSGTHRRWRYWRSQTRRKVMRKLIHRSLMIAQRAGRNGG